MGRLSKYKIGEKYGGLEILEIISSHKSGKHVKLKCICNFCKCITIKSGANIKNRNSCGCQQRISQTWKNKGPKRKPWQLPDGIAAKNNLEYQYKRGAKKRNLEYKLTTEEFINLVLDECFYCGSKNVNIKKGQGKTSGDFYYHNGIDRVDNDKGYISDNCVPCCWKCNNMKNTMKQKDFINHIISIYKKMFLTHTK